jgi:FlaA1/EpsC-like NDP-sugar epimerase
MLGIKSYIEMLLELPRRKKRLLSVCLDLLGIVALSFFALSLRFGELISLSTPYLLSVLILPFIAIPIFIKLGLYRAVIRYLGLKFAYTVFIAVSTSFVLWAAILFMFELSFPRSAIIIDWLLVLLFIASSRIAARSILVSGVRDSKLPIKKRVVIYGAGNSGQQLLSTLLRMPFVKVIGFVDDCKQLQKNEIHSTKVFLREDFDSLIEQESVTDVFLAIPSASQQTKKEILNWLESKRIKVSTLPPMGQIVNGQVTVSDIREVEIEDLLGRNVVPPEQELLEKCIKDKVVFVSGAGGSIGSELCRQVVNQSPRTLILYELSEFALYQIDKELQNRSVEVISILGSVLNQDKLKKVFAKYQVETIYHAAAYKHVPLVEHNIAEGIRNNSFATMAIAETAAEHGVKNFVLISTDKAVRPTNFMGATKRLAEMSLQALQDKYSQTQFVMVRFGNVLGSSGSVIPLFKKQIREGGPITVTHPEITRFFMTIPEAASLVIQAGSMGKGGDVFVLDMGESVKILDLAKRLIHLSGLEEIDTNGNGDIDIQFSGLRPGEKLYEELLIGDNADGTDHPKIMKAHEEYLPYDELSKYFNELDSNLSLENYEGVQYILKKIVSGFNHQSGVVDYLASKNNEA